jgi:hypothetical protein
MADGTASFSGIPGSFVFRVCEAIWARSTKGEPIVLGDMVSLKLVLLHNSGHDRYMLIGPSWQAGFNASIPDDDNVKTHMFMGAPHVISERGVENQTDFVRDMVLLKVMHSEWEEPFRESFQVMASG